MTQPTAPTIAVIGGSGLYDVFDGDVEHRLVATPYGDVTLTIGDFAGRRVAFLARHGSDHSVPPHRIHFRANVWALRSVGVRALVTSAAVGGLSPDFPPGTLALTDQFIDRTHGRPDTYFDGEGDGGVQHLAAAEPFCPTLLGVAREALAGIGEQVVPASTMVVIQGPRFSTRAESAWFRAAGGHTVNMTLVPEVPLAAELGIGYVNLAFVTDGDADVDEIDDEDLSAQVVFERLAAAGPRLRAALAAIVAAIPDDYVPRELIPEDAVAAVLARPVARPSGSTATTPPDTASA